MISSNFSVSLQRLHWPLFNIIKGDLMFLECNFNPDSYLFSLTQLKLLCYITLVNIKKLSAHKLFTLTEILPDIIWNTSIFCPPEVTNNSQFSKEISAIPIWDRNLQSKVKLSLILQRACFYCVVLLVVVILKGSSNVDCSVVVWSRDWQWGFRTKRGNQTAVCY